MAKAPAPLQNRSPNRVRLQAKEAEAGETEIKGTEGSGRGERERDWTKLIFSNRQCWWVLSNLMGHSLGSRPWGPASHRASSALSDLGGLTGFAANKEVTRKERRYRGSESGLGGSTLSFYS